MGNILGTVCLIPLIHSFILGGFIKTIHLQLFESFRVFVSETVCYIRGLHAGPWSDAVGANQRNVYNEKAAGNKAYWRRFKRSVESLLPSGVQQGSTQHMAEPPQGHLGQEYNSSPFLWQRTAQSPTGSLKWTAHCEWSASTVSSSQRGKDITQMHL